MERVVSLKLEEKKYFKDLSDSNQLLKATYSSTTIRTEIYNWTEILNHTDPS